MTDLEIYFQEAVISRCDQLGVDPNLLDESDWNWAHDRLEEFNFERQVERMVEFAYWRTA